MQSKEGRTDFTVSLGLMQHGPIYRTLSSGDLGICCPVVLALFTVIAGKASIFSVQVVITV